MKVSAHPCVEPGRFPRLKRPAGRGTHRTAGFH